jgi:hypothetical protein
MAASPRYSWLLLPLALALAAFVAAPAGRLTAEEKPKEKTAITAKDVNAAQQAWCDGLVKIGKAFADKKDYKAVAKQVIADTYDFEEGKVFFKPTLAHGKNTFRTTKEGTLSYFVGGNSDFPEDKGFALKPWVKVRYDNTGGDDGIQVHGEIALTMGNVYLADDSKKEIMVDKTFAFRRCKDGKLRIIVHKSALPFEPEKK